MEYQLTNTQILKHPLKSTLIGLIVTLFCSCSAVAQSLSTDSKKAAKAFEKAEEFYSKHQYSEAKTEIKTALEKDADFVEALTLKAYIAMDEAKYSVARESFEKAVKSNANLIKSNLYYLAELELKDGDYTSAQKHFREFLSSKPTNERQFNESNGKLDQIEYALNAVKNPVQFDPINLGPEVNSQYAEYFPCLTVDNSTLLFTRRLPEPNSPAGFNEDFYVSSRNGSTWSSAQNIGKPINTALNEGAPSLSADGSLLIFTACELYGNYGGERNGLGSCDLFYTLKQGKNWSRPYNLGQTINSKHWETQPSFSADGKTLYFVRGIRDRQGSRTGDIYSSTLKTDNSWSKPEKLNRNINTNGNEESVFIHPDGKTLYFSSDGHQGMGSLDIFMSRKDSVGEWGPAINLGYPINTHKNENSLLISSDGETAFFASDREEGYGDLDLYSFKLPEQYKAQPVTYFAGKIFNKKNQAPLAAKFELIDLETGELVVESFSDPTDGKFLLSLPMGKKYALNANKEGYLFYSESFNLKEGTLAEPYQKNVPLSPIEVGEKIILKNIFFETGKYALQDESKIELNKLIEFLKANPSVKIEVSGHTDNVGNSEMNQTLSENRANSVAQYLHQNEIMQNRISAKGFGDLQPIATNETDEGRAQNRRTEFKVISK